MIVNKGAFVLLIISFLLIKWTKSENKENTKLKDALRNSTSTSSKNQNNDRREEIEDDNILKTEAKKILKQCGVDSNESEDMDGFGNRNNKNGFNKYGENSFNNKKLNNYRRNNKQGGNEYGNSDNDDGDWNAYGSQNGYGTRSQGNIGNINSNTNRRGSNNNAQRQDNDQRYPGSQNEYGNRGRGGQYDQNSDNNQNNKYGFYGNYGSSSNRDTNRGNEYGGYNSNTPNEYGSQNSPNRNGFDNQNSNNRNPYDGQGYGSNNYGQTSSQGDLNDNRRTQEYGGTRGQNTDRGYRPSNGNNNKNSYYPYSRFGGNNHRKEGCNENRDSSLGYLSGGSFGLTREQHRPRSIRDSNNNYFNKDKNEENDDNQCISQCVFGYMQLLDNDRTPSETMVIKWLQEHVKGNDMERIKALRDARRCFARLTTSDTEDGCDFSKELAGCLELDLE